MPCAGIAPARPVRAFFHQGQNLKLCETERLFRDVYRQDHGLFGFFVVLKRDRLFPACCFLRYSCRLRDAGEVISGDIDETARIAALRVNDAHGLCVAPGRFIRQARICTFCVLLCVKEFLEAFAQCRSFEYFAALRAIQRYACGLRLKTCEECVTRSEESEDEMPVTYYVRPVFCDIPENRVGLLDLL